MQNSQNETENNRESIFLNERFMAVICVFIAAASLISLTIFRSRMSSFEMFESVVQLSAAVFLYLSFRFYKWDIVKGLMGGLLFCLMYHEAYIVFDQLWVEAEFDTFLAAGFQGSLYLASAVMGFILTVIITVNHFLISYDLRGNPKNVIFARITIVFKFAIYVLLFISNSQLGFSPELLWRNACQFLTNIAVLLLLICVQSHFDSLKILRQEILKAKRKEKRKEKRKGGADR